MEEDSWTHHEITSSRSFPAWWPPSSAPSVIIDGARIYGDGVNIATRVQGLSDGGGVCISSSVYDEIASKLSLGCDSIGEHTLKNIDEPVRVYRVRVDSSTHGEAPKVSQSAETGPGLDLCEKPSVAVLPFANIRVKIPDVGRELGVSYVLEGSVRKVGDQVRITAQLVDAVAGHHL